MAAAALAAAAAFLEDAPAARAAAAAAAPPARQAFATLVTTDDYVPGAQALLHSLRATGTARPLVCLVTRGVSARARAKLRCDRVVDVPEVANPHDTDGCWAASGYSKLALWGLHADYDVVVYVDCDAVVLENVDELFAVDADLAAAPDVFPPDRFNAGVLVVRPAAAEHARLLALAPHAPSHDGGDTGLLNAAFPDWFAGHARLRRLPFAYNAQRTLHWFTRARPGYWDACKPIKVLHFSSAPKPWQSPDRKGDLEMVWWDFFLAAQLAG